ncbi:MAG: hypothetical protein MK160_04820 [Rhodobacteraceae bacterium]|nr:hypothetical protein [Paracoccaceae bacterium]
MGILLVNEWVANSGLEYQTLNSAECHIYSRDAQVYAPAYQDPALTHLRESRLVADKDGKFPICYLAAGTYQLVIRDHLKNDLFALETVRITDALVFGPSRQYCTLDDILNDNTMGYGNVENAHEVAEGDVVTVLCGGYHYRVAAQTATNNQLITRGGVKLYIQPNLDGVIDALSIGLNADGVNDDADGIQKLCDIGRPVRFPAGYSFRIMSSIQIENEINIHALGSEFVGNGTNGDSDLFSIESSENFRVYGAEFRGARRAIVFTDVANVDIVDCSFEDLVHGIAVVTCESDGALKVENCRFKDLECGINVQTSRFSFIDIEANHFEQLLEKSIINRIYPLGKKISSGLWVQSLTGSTSINVRGNFVDGVAEFSEPPNEPEVHGLAVSVDANSETDVKIIGNTVRNVTALSSVEGCEGILGRGRRVIIQGNTLRDAGGREGMIYAKGSLFHKIESNIIEASESNPLSEDLRGVISTGANCDVTNNKFINVGIGIFTRALNARYAGNEFVNAHVACYVFSLQNDGLHRRTEVSSNRADENCGTFFLDISASDTPHGDFHIFGNILYNKGHSLNLKGGDSVIFKANHVDRKLPDASRECLTFLGATNFIQIMENTFASFDDSSGTGRVLSGYTNYTPRIFVQNNHFQSGNYALWMRDQVYEDYVISGNSFFSENAINGIIGTNVSVSGISSVESNIGLN